MMQANLYQRNGISSIQVCLFMAFLFVVPSQQFQVPQNSPHPFVLSNGTLQRVVNNDTTMKMEKLIKGASSTKKDELSYDAIQNIIDVSRPYYALENESVIKVDGKPIGFAAEVSQEMPFHIEEGGHMGFSEAMRHMAIAGSVAAALANPKVAKNYYLALNGSMQHNDVLPKKIQDEIDNLIPYTAGKAKIFAYSTSFNKREATSEVYFSSKEDGNFIRLNVSYKVLSESVYSRFFPPLANIDESKLGPWCPQKHNNPYTDPIYIPISDSKFLDHNTIFYQAKIPTVCPSKCFGHFDTSPCLPVAFLIAHLVDAAMQSVVVLCNEYGVPTKPLIAKTGFLDAKSLVQAGTHGLKVEGKTTRIDDGVYEFSFDTFTDNDAGSEIAHLQLVFAEKE
ncbi:hypothetical protein CTEN210_14548 [Chaetoceros tenuissimus]|uniref:Uncharacterized protein n=1 Tax=Chaetoceros tenuissimus TaxID=426638 RepID=A0AAD3D5Y2_9STRA|nr:hypothetical protein CTEN210_14548 [Chaetoceros tenuissimus]